MLGNPFPLKQNAGKSFQGCIVLGKGFILTPEQAESLIAKDPRNKDVLFPYLNGDDLNNDPEQKPSRWVINFFDWSEEKARTYPDCFEIVERLVKPERDKLDESKSSTNKNRKENWWKYGSDAKNLYKTISKLDQVMAANRYTKYLVLDFQPRDIVFSDSINILVFDSYLDFSILSSALHEIWAWKYSSTMGASTLRYSPINALDTFPFPNTKLESIAKIGKSLNEARKKIMSTNNIGITEMYNLFHRNNLNKSNELHFELLSLRDYHSELDNEVLRSYDWHDIKLKHDFYELDYLPENDRVRFSVHPNARKEILNRLLSLNHERYNDEILIRSSIVNLKKTKPKKLHEGSQLFNDLDNS